MNVANTRTATNTSTRSHITNKLNFFSFFKLYFPMMTGGNLWFEVRFEIGMLGRGSDIGGREYWGLGGKQAWRGTQVASS